MKTVLPNSVVPALPALFLLLLGACSPAPSTSMPATEAPSPESRRPEPFVDVPEVPRQFDELGRQVLAALRRRDFSGFSDDFMLSRSEHTRLMRRSVELCPDAFDDEDRQYIEKTIESYDPRGDAVRASFDKCLATLDLHAARVEGTSPRWHTAGCGLEGADEIVVYIAVGTTESAFSMGTALKTADGWKLAGRGLDCD